MSALRRAAWPVRYAAVKQAFVRDGINPATGRKCKLHKCEDCGELFPAKDVQADHVDPVVPLTGFDSWDNVIARMYCEIDGYQIFCKPCHQKVTAEERRIRKLNKDKS